ncbi:hypothetical protein EES43_28890 [Streptomyces sp. ADI96-02]|uniref:hypothetical protein n=1 Tax=Streptomyces sp. ADI96-02 TaxID=1522760 RepID=UPI000FC0A16B|nr:hypothetical protein EES43_28890 [Streptomyces sp. ADI96-02]
MAKGAADAGRPVPRVVTVVHAAVDHPGRHAYRLAFPTAHVHLSGPHYAGEHSTGTESERAAQGVAHRRADDRAGNPLNPLHSSRLSVAVLRQGSAIARPGGGAALVGPGEAIYGEGFVRRARRPHRQTDMSTC